MGIGAFAEELAAQGVVVVPDAFPLEAAEQVRAELAALGMGRGGRTNTAFPLNLVRKGELGRLRRVAAVLDSEVVRRVRAEVIPKGWTVSDVLGIEHGLTETDIAPWHRDAVGRQERIKFYWYLSDTTPANGAFCYARGSHRTTQAEPPPGQHDLPGKAGTLIVFNEHGLHRGGTVTEGRRSILRVSFMPVTGRRAVAFRIGAMLYRRPLRTLLDG